MIIQRNWTNRMDERKYSFVVIGLNDLRCFQDPPRYLHAGEPGNPVIQITVCSKAWIPERPLWQIGESWVWRPTAPWSKDRRRWMFNLQMKEILHFLCIFVAFQHWKDWIITAHSGEGWSCLQKQIIQIIIFPWDILMKILWSNVLPAI